MDTIGTRYKEYSSLEKFNKLTWRQIHALVENVQKFDFQDKQYNASLYDKKLKDQNNHNTSKIDTSTPDGDIKNLKDLISHVAKKQQGATDA